MVGFHGSAATWLSACGILQDKHYLGLFGRSKGKPLSPAQQHRMKNLLPSLGLGSGQLSPKQLWPQAQQVWVEIGIGGGEHFVHQASQNPDMHLIGFEPFQNGMAKTLGAVERLQLQNISLEMTDARDVLARFEDHSIDRMFILYPDPWPKRRHWKRRLIEPLFIAELARLMKPGAQIRFVSDIAHYQQWALWHFLRHPDFEWQAQTCNDWQKAPADHCTTKYEQKAFREKRHPAYLHFIRKGL